MALIKCIHCGAQISDQAIICPKCGQSTSTASTVKNNKTTIQIIRWGTLGILAIFAVLGGQQLITNHSIRESYSSSSKPASEKDIYLYRGLGSSFLCNSLAANVDFKDAINIAATTYVQVLNGRHGGIVKEAGEEKLTEKQLFAGAEYQIISGGLQYCPRDIPDNIKAKMEETRNNQ